MEFERDLREAYRAPGTAYLIYCNRSTTPENITAIIQDVFPEDQIVMLPGTDFDFLHTEPEVDIIVIADFNPFPVGYMSSDMDIDQLYSIHEFTNFIGFNVMTGLREFPTNLGPVAIPSRLPVFLITRCSLGEIYSRFHLMGLSERLAVCFSRFREMNKDEREPEPGPSGTRIEEPKQELSSYKPGHIQVHFIAIVIVGFLLVFMTFLLLSLI